METIKEKILRIQREQRASNGNAYTKKYEKTKNGFLMLAYRNMLSRISGVQSRKHHLYKGKDLLSREEFYSWAKASREFHALFDAWELSGYSRKLTPSTDRINSRLGYFIENMRWVTHSENSRNIVRPSKARAELTGAEDCPLQ
jgi:hypothetical protein